MQTSFLETAAFIITEYISSNGKTFPFPATSQWLLPSRVIAASKHPTEARLVILLHALGKVTYGEKVTSENTK